MSEESKNFSRPRGFSLSRGLIFAVLCGYLLWVVYPVFWVAYSSLKPDAEIFRDAFALPAVDQLAWENYARAWREARFGDYFFNSVLVTSVSVAAIVLLGAMAACESIGQRFVILGSAAVATAAARGLDLLVILVDNGSYGTIRMHQERDYPGRTSGTDLANPDFAALARAYGGWAETVERTEDFAPALDRALEQRGIRLIHCKTDVEVISNQTTIARLREKTR